MIQVYTDGVLAYDTRLEDYDLQGLKITTGLNKGGTAEIVMPPNHPAYGSFTSYKTIVEIYRDGYLLFRGRALYPMDDRNNQRTVVCEGELCFFQDTISRPYLYQDTPAAVLAKVVGVHNVQADPSHVFVLGEVTVTDPNDYIRLESETAESVLETLNKLLERCGGYIVFTTDGSGRRVINWYASLGYRSDQVIEFGENLLDFSRNGSNTNLATAVLPYGAQDENGQRITIESVNDGRDYIQADEAVALRGFIIKAVTWDDVTEPANLLRKAQEWLNNNRYIVTALRLTAIDLSYIDKTIDSYQVGDTIHVRSKPHGVDEDFLLTERTEDLLNPAGSNITLGKDKSSLTGADVAGDTQNRTELHKVTHKIKSDYTLNVANAVQETEKVLSSLIEQTSREIKLEVSQTYLTNDQVDEKVSTSLVQTEKDFTFNFDTLKRTVDDNDTETREQFNTINKYIRFEDGNITLGEIGNDNGNTMTLTLENDMIVFKKNGVTFGWWDGVDFHTGNIVVEVNERAQFGNFAFVPRSNGSLSFLKVGG